MDNGRRGRVLSLWGVALAAAAPAAAFAGAPPAASAPAAPASGPIAEQRLALYAAPPPGAPAGEAARRAFAIAELEERAGNPDLAAAALERALRLTVVEAAIDALTGDPGKGEASARFDEALSRALDYGKRTGDGHLVLAALRVAPEVAEREVEAVRAALLVGVNQVPSELHERVRAAAGTTPAWRAFLEEAWPPDRAGADAGLEGLGDLGARLLHERLSDAFQAGDVKAGRRLADRIWSADRWNLEARVVRHLLDDVQAGVALTAADLASVVNPATIETRVVVRLDRVRAARPEAVGVSLAIAYRLQLVHLFADVQREAARVLASPRATAEERLTAQALDVLAKLEAGPAAEPEAIRWQKASGAERSLAWARVVLDRPRPSDGRVTRQPLGALDRAVLARVFADPFGPTTAALQSEWARRAAQALDAPPLRNAALAVLAREDWEAARLVKGCAETAVAFDECSKRLELLESLGGDDDDDDWGGAVEPAEVLSRLADLPASRLEVLAGGAAKNLATLGPALARLRNDRYAGTPGFVHLELAVDLAQRDWAAARATFARGAALLPIDVRTSARLLLATRGARPAAASKAAHAKADPLALPTMPRLGRTPLPSKRRAETATGEGDPDAQAAAADDDDDEGEGGGDGEAKPPAADDGGLAKLVTALWMRSAHPKRALDALRPAWQRVDGAEGGELAGWAFTLAHARDPALARRAQARMLRIAPLGEATARVSAELALDRKDGAEARRWARRAWQADVDAAPAGALFARAFVLGASPAAIPPETATWIARLGAAFPFTVWARLAKALDARLAGTVAGLGAHVAAEGDVEKSLELSPEVVEGFQTASWIGGRLASLSPAAVVPFAARATAYLARRRDKAPLPALAFWAPFIAGDAASTAEAARLAAARKDDRRRRFDLPYMQRLTATEPARLLAALRAPLPVLLRQQVFKGFERGEAAKTDLPALIDAAAEAAKDKGDAAGLRQLACLAADHLKRTRQALSLCGRAWASGGARTAAVASSLAKLVASNPDEARAEKIDGAAFFREATQTVTGDRAANLRHEQAVWLSKLGRQQEAAALEADAWAGGYALDGSPSAEAIEWTPYQPLLVRMLLAQSQVTGAEQALAIGVAAMGSGDAELATPYLRRAAALADADKTEEEKQQWANFLVDMSEVAAADLAKKRIDRAAISEAFLAVVHQVAVGALPGLARRFPRSLFLALLAADDGIGRLQAPSAAVMTELQREFPENVIVLHTAIRALEIQKKHGEAVALIRKAVAAHPGDKRLASLGELIGLGVAPKGPLPPWAASTAAFAPALAKAEPSGALVEKARLESDQAGGFDLYAPEGFTKVASPTFMIGHQGVNISVGRIPRVTYCSGPACLEDLVPLLEQQGLEEQWSHAVKLPLGDGQEGLFRGPAGLVLVAAVPVGPYVFYVSAGGAGDKLYAALPAVRLVRDTLRYRDAALGPARTALLRRQVYPPWTAAGVAARVRLELAAATGEACPIAAELGDLESSARVALVADLYLSTARPEDRARLLRCFPVSRDANAALALEALWDSDPSANAFGRAAVARVAAGIVRALGAGVDLTAEQTSYDPSSDDEELLAGVIQVMTLLPAEEVRSLGARFMASGEPRLRALALAASYWVAGAVAPREVEAVLRSGSDGEASVLAGLLPDPIDVAARAAMRARLAALPGKPNAPQRRLAAVLALRLAPQMDPSDTAALARARALLAAGADAGVSLPKHAVAAIDAHALAVSGPGTGAASAGVGAAGSTTARTLLASWRSRPSEKAAAARSELERPLADRLPDHGWNYFRVGQPGAFLAGIADLANAAGTTGGGRSTARSLLRRIVSTLAPEELHKSGIDVDQPFECAVSTSDADAWACTAALSDVAAARLHPAGRAGHRSGVTLPWLAGAMAVVMPTSNLFLPMLLPHEPPPPTASDEPAPETGWLVTEQVTDTMREAGVELRRAATLYVGRDHGVRVDESLTFVGRQRVWLFSDSDVARVWLALPARAAGTSPARALGARAAGLVAWTPAGEDDDVPDGLILEADGSSAGVRIRIRTPLTERPADTRGLAELLAPGAALSFVGANVAGAPVWQFRSLGLLSPSELTPPLWLWQAAEVVAFGWYAADRTQKTDEGWMSIMPWSPALEKAWRAHHLPAPGTAPASLGGISFVRRGPALVIGSRPGLLAARTAPLVAASAAVSSPLPVTARADGAKLADLLERRAAGARAGSSTAAGLKNVAAIAGLVASAETKASVRDGVLTSETWIRPTFAARGSGGSSIGELLRNQRLKNSLRLPRPLGAEAAARGVTLTFSGVTAETMRRAFPDSDRLTLAQAGPDRFKVTVLPRAKPRKAEPLSEADRRLYVSPGGTAPPGAVRATAAAIVGKTTAPWDRMRAVVDWVKREMKYEITPRQLDDVTLLELRRGDCTEYAQLTIALLRALGIPARMRTGLAGEGSVLVAHAWVEFHDGEGWHEIDPTAGRTSIDASYIDVSVMDLLPLLVDGGLRITDLE